MSINLNYGLDGVRQKNYRVWIANDDIEDINTNIKLAIDKLSTVEYYSANLRLSSGLGLCKRFGECRKDSIVASIDDGDTVEGNEVGEIELNKQTSFTAELINATPDNINELANNYDGKPCVIILESLDGYEKLWAVDDPKGQLSKDTREIIVIGGLNGISLSVSEAITGGDIARATISMNDSVPTIDDFRTRFEIPYDIDEDFS